MQFDSVPLSFVNVLTDFDRCELAKCLWEKGDDNIPTAIVASHISRRLAHKLKHHHSTLQEEYKQNAQYVYSAMSELW